MEHTISYFDGGFKEQYPSGAVEAAFFYYEASATVCFRDGRETKLPLNPSSYQAQFGIPFSMDGKLMFFYTWEKGVEAISLETGKTVWELRAKHAGRIAVYESYLIVIQQALAILKVEIETGQILARIGCDVHHRFDLVGPYQLIDSIRGKVSVLDTRDMSVRKSYPKERVNPHRFPTCIIREIELKGETLSVSGFENDPPRRYTEPQKWHDPQYFTRVIDEQFYEGLS